MKKLLLITTPLLLVACHHYVAPAPVTQTTAAQPSHANLPAETARQGQYIALPGQAAVDTDAAFDQQVAAYAGQPVQTVAPQAPMPQQGYAQLPTVESAIGGMAPAAPAQTVDGMMPTAVQTAPTTITAMGTQAMDSMGAAVSGVSGAAMGMMQPAAPAPVGGLVDYTLRITNATSGRVFIEAQDAAGEIYPCGFMTGSQSISSEKKQVAPIKGPITVVVRDPDKPDAPELRRYKVTPPADYAGKMLEITIISGGLYQVSVNGQVRYITPTPVGKPDLGTTPANPQPAPAPAAGAATAAAAPAPAAPAPAAPASAAPAAPAAPAANTAASAAIPEPEPAGM